MKERLQKVMAECGVASRRKCEEIIKNGLVKVNGHSITELGFKVDKLSDKIEVNGKKISNQQEKIYVMLNKPVGCITTAKDQFDRPTVLDLVGDIKERIFPVGRLDYDTEGLLILTNDGELTYTITHPKHNINKTYRAVVKGKVDKSTILTFEKGIIIDNYQTKPSKLEILKYTKNSTLINITIHEGRNRQVRKMCSAVNHPVEKLKRISIGKIKLGNLKTGQWRFLTNDEIDYLFKAGGSIIG